MAKQESKKHPHEALINEVYEQLKEVFEKSKQAIYVYYDDTHKICNQRFGSLFG